MDIATPQLLPGVEDAAVQQLGLHIMAEREAEQSWMRRQRAC
jgi:hypothetical protein